MRNMGKQKVQLDFKNMIKCALDHEISWPALKVVLDSATTTFEKSKKLNNILLEELEVMQSKQIQRYETHSMLEHELSEKDEELSVCTIDQSIENDDSIYNQTAEVEESPDINKGKVLIRTE